jgi:acyl carrier protein
MTQDIIAKILDVISETTSIPRDKISVDSTFEKLGIDSLDSIDLLVAIEDAFHLSAPDEKLSIKSVRELINLLEESLPAAQAA